MKQSFSTFLALVALNVTIWAQNTREVQMVSPNLNLNPAGISISSENGDLSALLYKDTGDESVWLRTSDGRGINWGLPLRIDDDTTGSSKKTSKYSLKVDDNRIYIAWEDRRNGTKDDLYFTSSEDSGLTWLPANIRLDDGFGPGNNDLKDFRIGSGGKDVIAICSTDDGLESLFLTYSNDAGATWSPAIEVTTHNGFCDVDNIDMACEDDIAYIVWRDNFNNGVDDSVWMSIFNFKNGSFVAQDINVSPIASGLGGDADDGVCVAVDDNYLCVLFHADNLGGSSEQIRVNMSSDLGLTFTGDFQVGEYDNASLNHDVDNGCLVIEDGKVAVAWRDDRAGHDEIYCAVADFATGIFTSDHICSNSVLGVSAPHIAGEFGGEPLAISWSQGSVGAYYSCYLVNDVWSSPFVVSNNLGEVDDLRLTWNDTYNNFLALYLCDSGGRPEVWAGGYRAQQIDPGDPIAGNHAVFSISGFKALDSFQVVVAENQGTLLISDGRNLGIAFDNYTRITKNLSAFGGVLDSDGNASTTSLVIPPALSGKSLYMLAVSINNGSVRNFSDVTRVDIQ